MEEKRKPISKKTRFEVFKRDNFTCQYCGRMAPDVILEIDHINPVKNGGNNNILNLITSCFDCNRGKGKRLLSSSDEIKKQQEQLKLLNTKREQLQMLIKWKEELEKFDDEEVNKIEELLEITENSFSNYGRQRCKEAIKKYGFEEVYESAKISLNQYYNPNDNESADKVFSYIWRICAVRAAQKKEPNIYEINYLIKIAKNNLRYVNSNVLKALLKQNFNKEDFEDLKILFIGAKNWTELINSLEEYYEV